MWQQVPHEAKRHTPDDEKPLGERILDLTEELSLYQHRCAMAGEPAKKQLALAALGKIGAAREIQDPSRLVLMASAKLDLRALRDFVNTEHANAVLRAAREKIGEQ